MREMLRAIVSTRRLALAAVLATVAVLCGACGGTTTKLNTAPLSTPLARVIPVTDGAEANVEAATGMPALPSPAQIERGASVIETGLTVQGSSFRPDLTHQNTTVDGAACVFDPAFLSGDDPRYSQCAVAIFSFDLSDSSLDLSSISDLDLDGQLDLVVGTAHVFAGFPALSLDHWEWTEMTRSSAPGQLDSFSWGMSNPGQLRERAPKDLLNVCIVVFGDTALRCSRLAFQFPTSSSLSLSTLFSRGWDGTYKGRSEFGQSVSVCVDGSSTVHSNYYDSSNGQLYHLRVADRVVTTQALDCDVDSGLTNDLVCTPDGRLLASFWGDEDCDDAGECRLAVLSLSSPDALWEPPVTCDSGDDGTGAPPSDVGRNSSIIVDDLRNVHVFYEDRSSGRIKRSSLKFGVVFWTTEFVSPPGVHASCPVALDCDDGVCCLYLDDEDGDASTDNRLMLARLDATSSWSSVVVADDVTCPLPSSSLPGFCDGAVSGNLLVTCYSTNSGLRVSVHDIAKNSIQNIRACVADPSPSSGAFCDLEMLGDGSVRVAHYDTFDTTIFMASSTAPTDPQFSCSNVPVLSYGVDEDCDDLAFYLDPDDDGDGFHEAVLVDLSSSLRALTQTRHYEFRGHVTVLK